MIEYPNDKLYRRVGNLLIELKDIASKNGSLQIYTYLLFLVNDLKPDDIEWIIKTENHILSLNFLTQSVSKDKDKESMIAIIRDYKLNQLL
jgi:hypothetical protein